jgi:hypothetical protein
MGFFKDVHELKKMGKEASKNYDAKSQMSGAMERMAAAQDMLAQQTVAAQLQGAGEPATAQVRALRDTGTLINMQPVLEIDLLVNREGAVPYPATVSQMVSHAQLGVMQPGAVLAVKVDPAHPATVLIG